MNKKIKYGIIGSGAFADTHLAGLERLHEAEVVALCDKYVEKCYPYAEKYGIPKEMCYSDYNEMLKLEEIDAIIVATPDKAHASATVAALNAGKHVLCEKPMALNLDDCREMIKAADETGNKLMIGQICRMTPGFIEAKRLVDDGVIGELYYVESEYAHDYSHIPGTDNWRMDPDREPIIGGACHAIDLLRWIAGDPVETTAYSNQKVLTSWPVSDTTIAIFKFPNNIIGKVFCSIGCKRNYTMRTVLYGTQGTIIVNNSNSLIRVYRERSVSDEYLFDGAIKKISANEPEYSERSILHSYGVGMDSHNSTGENKAFMDAIINDTPVPTDGREGAKTVAVCRAVVESAKTGKSVTIDYSL